MKFGHKLQLRTSQRLAMTQKLQQSIRILQLSSLDLQTEVQETLASNIMLETGSEAESDAGDAGNVSVEEPKASTEAGAEVLAEEEVGGAEADIPKELPVDASWEDIYSDIPVPVGGREGTRSSEWPITPTDQRQTLHDYLERQLDFMPLDETQRAVCAALIDAIDDHGYLTSSLQEIRDLLERVTPEMLEEMLAVVQDLDPPGVGARDLAECLLLQLRQLPPETPYLKEAQRLVDEGPKRLKMDVLGILKTIADGKHAKVKRLLKLDQEIMERAVSLIRSLDPKPGGRINGEPIEYVIPDVYVRKEKDRWRVEPNPELIPSLRINKQYLAILRGGGRKDVQYSSVKEHLKEARWFLHSLQSRATTVLRIARSIVQRQRMFLEYGERAMKPMVLKEVADEIGVHESTASRAVAGKYMHTPRGLYEFKYFFSSQLDALGVDAGVHSSTAVRAMIRNIVEEETPGMPLRDQEIATRLTGQGVRVARRTIAKYRRMLGIPPCHERKRAAV